jgi:hypothetical protein
LKTNLACAFGSSGLVWCEEFRTQSLTIPIWRRIRNIIPPRERIAELEDKLARAEVINVSKPSGSTIKFGATVTLIEEDTREKKVWQIVGEPESDVDTGKISVTSPVARALIGKSKGATVEVETPGGDKIYKVLQVQWRVDAPKKGTRHE